MDYWLNVAFGIGSPALINAAYDFVVYADEEYFNSTDTLGRL